MRRHPTKQKIVATVWLVVGLGLLAGIIAYLGAAPAKNFAHVSGVPQLAASASSMPYWQSLYPYYDAGRYGAPSGSGWPLPHAIGDFEDIGAADIGNPPVPSYVDAFPINDQSQRIVIVTKLRAASYPVTSYSTTTAQSGSITVPLNTPIRVEWACQDNQILSYGSGRTKTYADYASSIGVGLSTGGVLVGSTIVNPAHEGLFTYGVQCLSDTVPDTVVMSFTINVGTPPPVPVLSLTPQSSAVPYNGTQTLVYSATGGGGYDACYLSGGQWGSSPGTPVGTSGPAATNSLTASTQYSYTCHDIYYGWVTPVSADVTVGTQAPTVSLAPSSQTISAGQNANFTYTLGGGTPTSIAYTVDGGPFVSAAGGSFSAGVLSFGSHSVVMVVANSGGSGTSNTALATVNGGDLCTDISGTQLSVPTWCVMPNPSPGACIPGGYFYDSVLNQCVFPALSLTAAPVRVQSGNSTTLTWSSQNVTAGSCTLRDPSGAVLSSLGSGSMSVVVNSPSVYTLSCGSPVGVETKSVTVILTPSFKEI